jgi:hypothetical protein
MSRGLMPDEGLDAAEAAFRISYESPSQLNREHRRPAGRWAELRSLAASATFFACS